MKSTIIALPPQEKSAERTHLEKCISNFIDCIEEVNYLGKKAGRECLAMDIVQGLTAIIAYAGTGELAQVTGVKSPKTERGHRHGKADKA